MTLAMSGATMEDAGLASGLVNTTAQVGGAIGLAVLATLSTTRTQHLLARRSARRGPHQRLPPGVLDRGRAGARRDRGRRDRASAAAPSRRRRASDAELGDGDTAYSQAA